MLSPVINFIIYLFYKIHNRFYSTINVPMCKIKVSRFEKLPPASISSTFQLRSTLDSETIMLIDPIYRYFVHRNLKNDINFIGVS